jgi:hypothetical protein
METRIPRAFASGSSLHTAQAYSRTLAEWDRLVPAHQAAGAGSVHLAIGEGHRCRGTFRGPARDAAGGVRMARTGARPQARTDWIDNAGIRKEHWCRRERTVQGRGSSPILACNAFTSTAGASPSPRIARRKYPGDTLHHLCLPGRDLVRVRVILLGQRGQRLLSLDGGQRHLGLESRRMCPARSSRHGRY